MAVLVSYDAVLTFTRWFAAAVVILLPYFVLMQDFRRAEKPPTINMMRFGKLAKMVICPASNAARPEYVFRRVRGCNKWIAKLQCQHCSLTVIRQNEQPVP